MASVYFLNAEVLVFQLWIEIEKNRYKCKNCRFITRCKAHHQVTHIKQQKLISRIMGRGYNKECILYPQPMM